MVWIHLLYAKFLLVRPCISSVVILAWLCYQQAAGVHSYLTRTWALKVKMQTPTGWMPTKVMNKFIFEWQMPESIWKLNVRKKIPLHFFLLSSYKTLSKKGFLLLITWFSPSKLRKMKNVKKKNSISNPSNRLHSIDYVNQHSHSGPYGIHYSTNICWMKWSKWAISFV